MLLQIPFVGLISLTLILLVSCSLNLVSTTNQRPIIGILDQETYGDRQQYGTTYIAASYVKWVESSGGRVVPIHVGQNISYYQDIVASINGVLFPGGGQSLPGSSYYSAASILYQLALQSNNAGDYFPLWGHCLGFELLTVLSSKGKNCLEKMEAEDLALPIIPSPDFPESRMFRSLPENVWRPLITRPVTVNFHQWGLSPTNFTRYGLDKFYNMLATNYDRKGKEFVSIIEGIVYPFFGLQFHPEKNNFEFTRKYRSIPHTDDSILVSQYFANVFISQARRSNHTFPSIEAESSSLIYNYRQVYTGKNLNTSFVQIYAFNISL